MEILLRMIELFYVINILFWVLYLLVEIFKRKSIFKRGGKNNYKILPVTVVLCGIIIGILFFLEFKISYNNLRIIRFLHIIWAILSSYLLMCHIMQTKNFQVEINLLYHQKRVLEHSYEQVNTLYTSNAKLYHDMKHHLNVLLYMLEEGNHNEAEEYIKSLGQEANVHRKESFTSIDIVDFIINDKIKTCEEKGIQMEINTQILPQDIIIEKKELCTLFANLLDNAIEAQPNKIYLLVKVINKMLLIQVWNESNSKLLRIGGKYHTTKLDRIHHGWGIQNIESIVVKYEGNIKFEEQEGKFCVDMIMNMVL